MCISNHRLSLGEIEPCGDVPISSSGIFIYIPKTSGYDENVPVD